MKIWILTSETPLYNPGGIARYVDNFSRYLGSAGHDVLVIGRSDKDDSAEIAPGYRFHSVVPKWDKQSESVESQRPDDHPSWPYNLLDYWSAFSYQLAEEVVRLIESEGPPDVIESQEYAGIAYYLLQKKLTEFGDLQDVPIVLNAHSPDFMLRKLNEEPAYSFPEYWIGQMEKASLLAADAVIAPSSYLCRQLEETFSDSSFKALHFPLPWTDPKSFEQESVEADPKEVLYYGRLEIRKGVLPLVEASRKLWSEGMDFTLSLIGSDTPYLPKGCSVGEFIQKKYAREIEEGKLKLPGAMPHADLMYEIQKAGTIVIPSIWENWPNTCIEAMSLGKVVIGSVDGGQAEMLGEENESGFIFDWREHGSFDRALSQALALTAEERAQRGDVARKRIAQLCSPELVINSRIEHFNEVIDRHEPKTDFPFVNEHLRHSQAKQLWSGTTGKKGLISVVIPFYNLGTMVEDAIDSLRESNYESLEIIVVNDGSTEKESLELLEKLRSSSSSDLKVVDIPNGGLPNARNVGVNASSGEFIALLDADDLVEPEFFPMAVRILRQYNNVHIVYCWERYFEGSHDIFPCWNFEFPYLLGHNMTNPITVMYRDSYLTFGKQKEKLKYNFEDYESWISMVASGCGGVSINRPLCRYRIRKDSLWQDSSREQHLHLYNLIVDEHPDLYQKYGHELFLLQNANGPAQKWIKPSAPSPYDEFNQWARRRIKNQEKESEKWWRESVRLQKLLEERDKELKSREARLSALKNELEEKKDLSSEKGFSRWFGKGKS